MTNRSLGTKILNPLATKATADVIELVVDVVIPPFQFCNVLFRQVTGGEVEIVGGFNAGNVKFYDEGKREKLVAEVTAQAKTLFTAAKSRIAN